MLQVSVPIAHELLGQCVKQGQALVQRASLVGDFSDYESWKSARKQWIDPTMQALEHMYGGPKEAREFVDTASCPEQTKRWQEQYSADLKCVEEGLDLLTVLRGELAFADGEAPPASAGELTAEIQLEPPPAETEERPFAEPDPETQERSVGAELAPSQHLGAELAHPASATPPAELDSPGAPAAPPGTRGVVLAHGRDERWKQAVEHLLEQAGEHEVTVVNRRGSGEGLANVLDHAHGTRYAVVLLTADDVGGPRLESEAEPFFSTRAHQQVVFEMGFLVAALSPGCVCVLYEDGVELPYDLDGISHVRLDLAGTWQPKLLLHLRRAGFDYDMNKLVSV